MTHVVATDTTDKTRWACGQVRWPLFLMLDGWRWLLPHLAACFRTRVLHPPALASACLPACLPAGQACSEPQLAVVLRLHLAAG